MSPTSTKCRAKDISKCPFHGMVTAEGMHQSFLREHAGKLLSAASPKPVAAAVKSSLSWKGKTPTWWDEYKKQAMNHSELPSTPEILDVIDSPVGKLAVVWQNHSQEKGDRFVTIDSGMDVNICYFKSFKTGENIGYIKLSSITEEALELSFGKDEFTPFRYQSRYSSRRYNFNEVDGDRNLTGDALRVKRREVWLDAMRAQEIGIQDAENQYVAAYSLTKKHVPDDITVAKDLKTFSVKFNKGMSDARQYFNIPFVDFSRVNSPISGKGYGTSLYVYAARKLGAQGQVLRGSGSQTDEAKKLWENLKKNFPQNVSAVKLNYKRFGSTKLKTFPIFDFRD